MDEHASRALAEILRTYGEDVVDDPRRLRKLLVDRSPGMKREVNALVAAVDHQVVTVLRSSSTALPWESVSGPLVRRMTADRTLDQSAVRWAIDSWGAALGFAVLPTKAGQISTRRTGATPEDEFNPYAPPRPESILEPYPSSGDRVWRDGPLLVMTKDAQLPDRCIKCNIPTGDWRLKRKLSWHPPAYYLFILLHILIYIIVALIVRHTATVMIPLCDKHRSRRFWASVVGWLLAITGVFVMLAGFTNEGYEAGIVLGLLLFLAGLIYGIAGSQVAVPKKIDDRFVWIKKVNPEFLDELPIYTF